jgi:protein TonB
MKLFMQQWNDELSNERNQIVFENRNRAYGAFAMREAYNDNMIKALFGGLLFFGLILMIPAFYGVSKIKMPDIRDIPNGEVVLEKWIIKPIIESSIQSKSTVEKMPDKLNVKASTTKEDQTKFDDLDKKVDQTISPTIDGPIGPGLAPSGTGSTDKPDIIVDKVDVKPDIKPIVQDIAVLWAPVMPLFPGGDDARKKFFSKNMTYPRIPLENGIEGTVIVNFIVGKNGEINDIKIVKSINKELDKEAIRVISLMPNWAPGMNNGKPVKVSFNLPVKFVIPN